MENIENHREHLIVIVLRAVDDSGNATSHNHSIVIDVRHQHGKFDVVTLMAALQGTDIESLNKDFINKELLPWQEGTTRSIVKKLRGVWLTLDEYAIVIAAKAASAKKGIKRQPTGTERGETTPKIPSWLFKSRSPKEKPCPIKRQRRGHSEEKQAKWPREDGGRGRSSLLRDHRANRDVQVRPTRGGLQEIRLHSERILAEPQGVLPVRDGSYKSTHQPMHHSVRRLYHSNALEVIG